MITVIVTFGAKNEFQGREIPQDIEKEFAPEELIQAVEFFSSAVGYFSQAIEFDSNYRGLGINVHLWDGNIHRVIERLG
jgi:hypothetical protein